MPMEMNTVSITLVSLPGSHGYTTTSKDSSIATPLTETGPEKPGRKRGVAEFSCERYWHDYAEADALQTLLTEHAVQSA